MLRGRVMVVSGGRWWVWDDSGGLRVSALIVW